MKKSSEKRTSCRWCDEMVLSWIINEMKNKKLLHVHIFIIFFLIIYAFADTRAQNDTVVVWAHSDVQPRFELEKKQYVRAVKDISELYNEINIAVFAGDIPQFKNIPDIFAWFLSVRKGAPVKTWCEIAGNHDWRRIEHYKKMINPNLYYSHQEGNLLFLLMSNEKYGRRTWISDATYQWWKNMVALNQDKIIITVTHGTLENNGLPASLLERLTIDGSERFAKTLKTHHVDIWISGHSHFPGWLPHMHLRNEKLGGTIFIDLGAIRTDIFTTSESRIIIFKNGSSKAILRYRDHSNKVFFDGNGYILNLNKIFRK